MGAHFSSVNDLQSNEYLQRFISEEILSSDNPFWHSFLLFNQKSPFNTQQSKLIEESSRIFLDQIEKTNPKTNNYGTLIEVFIRLANAVRDQPTDNSLTRQTSNALLILRMVTKHFVEIGSDRNLYPYFLPQENSNERISLMCLFVDTLYRTAIIIPVETFNYVLHLEVFNTLLSLLSIQMCVNDATLISAIYSIFMHRLNPLLISEFTRTLLEHFIKQIDCPEALATPSAIATRDDTGSFYKLGQTVASSFWSVMTFGMGSGASTSSTNVTTDASNNSSESTIDLTKKHLANQSIHLLLILSNHFTNDVHRNPYRLALLHFTDTQDSPTNVPDSEPLPWFSVDYRRLYEILCQTIHTDQSTLLLYMLLHRNQHFKTYVTSRTNIDQMVLPILRVIYLSNERNSHHFYMLLIIVLILSEDDYFNRTIHDIQLKKVSWFTERSTNGLTLGGLLISIILRTIQFNVVRMHDKYLHTNCLAALANMSSQFQHLNPSVTQRIISLFNLLSRKHSKLLDFFQQQSIRGEEISRTTTSNDDLTTVEDVMRTVLEIINSCLIHTLQNNVNLIYALLYNRDLFDNYRTHPNFQDVLQNIDLVIDYFSEKVDQLERRSADYVKEILEINVKKFPSDRLKKFADLKFKYVEEDQPEDFFVPYIWTLVYKSSNLYWSTEPILISLQQSTTTS